MKNTHSGQFLVMCTGTLSTCTSTLFVLVIFGQCVPVHIRGVPVHPVMVFLFRPVFVFWPYLSHFLSDLSDSSGQLK